MKKLSLLFAVLLATGCAITGGGPEFDALEADAAAAVKAAKKSGHEWRDSDKFLKKAAQAKEDGDYAQATKLLKKAKSEGELGQKQAADQQNAGPWLF
ncbi:MAG: SoxXA-binding protein [Gammaproteobacteria bacterium]|nr:SoxXA-binding protein [Gammaproteobacteria bacterium]